MNVHHFNDDLDTQVVSSTKVACFERPEDKQEFEGTTNTTLLP